MKYIFNQLKWILSLSFFFFFSLSTSYSQTLTKVKGTVVDGETGEVLPFVTVIFAGTTAGTTTDFDGNYEIETQWGSDKLVASYVGYESDTLDVVVGKKQTVDFVLGTGTNQLNEITIKAKRKRYKRRGNPAVAFVKKAIANKEKNVLEKNDYYEFKKYEKVELDINNITEKFRKNRIFKNYQFVFDNVDTSAINGKPYLPIYIQETNSRKYFRKSPQKVKKYRDAVRVSNFDKIVDDQTMSQFVNLLYQDVNIYNNNVDVVGIQFVSPLGKIAPFFYHFYINDTTVVNDIKCIDLAFQPANKQNFGFKGHLFISLDSLYTVLKVDMGVTDQINLNWVSDVRITQEFKKVEGHDVWMLSKDDLVLDFQVTKKGIGFFGRKNTTYSDLILNQAPDPSVWKGATKSVDAEDIFDKDEAYWTGNRPIELSEKEQNIYDLVDTLQTIKSFNTTVYLMNFVNTGYLPVGPIDIGPINGFYGFNPIEGTRYRIGGETNPKFSEKIRIQGQLLYADLDKKWKYSVNGRFAFNNNVRENPRHYLQLRHQHDTNFPGQLLEFINENNFLLSFKRGVVDKMIFYTTSQILYLRETQNDISYQFAFEKRRERPIGEWDFSYKEGDDIVSLGWTDVSEFSTRLRWAPNEEFLQGRNYRTNLFNKYPIFTLDYTFAAPNFLGSDFDYHKVKLNIFKRFSFSFLGVAHVFLEGGKIFGEGVPMNLMFLPRANQTYSYQKYSYNLMNFLEFVSDQYVSVNAIYYMNGYLLNKLPLIRKLKWREVFTFKLLYGSVTDKNNPNVNPNLIQFPTDVDGNATTFTLDEKPYMEGSVGLANIFKFGAVDLVQRFNYLDNPNVPSLFGVKGLGLRVRVGLEF